MLLPSRFPFPPSALARALSAVGLAALLSSCATMGGGLFPPFGGDDQAQQQAAIEKAPLDPMNVDPMAIDPLNVPPPAASTAVDGGGSQLVPLGSLSAADLAATPARRTGPAPLVPPAGAAATSPPAVMPAPSTQTTPATPPAAAPVQAKVTAPVLTPPPGVAPAMPATNPPPASLPTATQPAPSQPAVVAAQPQPETTRAFEPAKRTASAKTLASPRDETGGEHMLRESAPAAPLPDAREFIPAQIGATEPMMGGRAQAPRLSVGDSNVVRRFQILSKLLDEGLITQEEHDRRRSANIGALLQYSKEPPGLGLDRPVPAPGAISARLQALGRSLEMRAISTRQHELERNTILNSLLPERPDPRAPRVPPPVDMFALADSAARLAYIRDEDLISEGEFDSERAAMDRAMRGGDAIEKRSVNASGGAGAKAASAAGKSGSPTSAAPGPKAEAATAMPDTLSGPVLHLASFRSAEGARSAFEQAKAKNPQVFSNLRMEARKANIPGQGVFYRLLVGPFETLGEAEAQCVEMKKVDQFCRPTPDGS